MTNLNKVLCTLIFGSLMFYLALLNAQEDPNTSSSEVSEVNERAEAVVTESKDDSPAQSIGELVGQLEELLEYHGIPGMSVAIVQNNEITLAAGLGLSNIKTKEKATDTTRFRIGSISKMFVGLAALKLVEEGRLDLQSPVKGLAPEIEFDNPYENTNPVRFVHLLQHTAGWDDIHLPEYASNDPTPVTLEDALEYHPHSRISRWRPGERMSYANSGPPVAAYIIQKITGVEFEQYVKENFFTLLNMQSATYREVQENMATLYVDKEPVNYWHISMRPSGAINASALDMANFLLFLVNSGSFQGTELISPNSIRKMEMPSSTLAAKAGLRHGYGLTNYSSFYKGFKFSGHDGGVQGGAAQLVYDPKHKVGFYYAVNTDSTGMSDIFNKIAEYTTRDLTPPELPEVHDLSDEIIEKYSGFYMPVNPRQEMMRFTEQITGVRTLSLLKQGGLLSSGSESYEYLPVSDNLLRLKERPLASVALLEFDDSLAIQVGSQYLQKISGWRHYAQQSFMWAFIGLLVFHFFWFFWWTGRRLIGKSTSKAAIQVKLWPFLASLSIYITFIAMIIGQAVDVFELLGTPSLASISIMIGTYAFAICTIVAVIQNAKYIKEELHWFTRSACLFTCFVYTATMLYFVYFDVIGLRTFA